MFHSPPKHNFWFEEQGCLLPPVRLHPLPPSCRILRTVFGGVGGGGDRWSEYHYHHQPQQRPKRFLGAFAGAGVTTAWFFLVVSSSDNANANRISTYEHTTSNLKCDVSNRPQLSTTSNVQCAWNMNERPSKMSCSSYPTIILGPP
jgi:hypothetical protein